MFTRLYFIFNCFIALTLAYQCAHVTRSQIEQHLGTKTPYRVVCNKEDKEIKFKDCTPIRIWSIIRHGTRNPSEDDITDFKNYLMHIRDEILSSTNTKLCPHELALFRNWSCNLNIEEAKYLVYEGEDELIELAERLQKRFPKLLLDQYDPAQYKFRYTDTQRTMESSKSFTIGLFGRDNIQQIARRLPLKKDPILRFYKLCNRWKNDVKDNPVALTEAQNFLEGDEMRKLVRSISKRTGVNSINFRSVMLMYKICAFETAWSKTRISPWCNLFGKETITIPEFVEDLKHYWVDGYGYELTHKQACPAIKDMIEHIRPDSYRENATFYFTHSGTILKMLAHLGLYQDNYVLTAADFNESRKWRMSKIDAFASNIAFVTYKCSDEPKVLVLHQERIVRLPECPDTDLCSFKKFEKIFREDIMNCQFDNLCRI